jgi:hypothetical protein
MKAISLLIASGLTRKQIALTIGVTSHWVRLLEIDERFPGWKTYRGLVEMAEARGIQLMARDFFIERKLP